MKKFIPFLFLLTVACQTQTKKNTGEVADAAPDMTKYPELLVKALDAHGGLDQWRQFHSLSYDKPAPDGSIEHQTINLQNRHVLIDRDTVKIGFDGQQVWVSPNQQAFGNGSPRFYHNLYFYFFGMPFLLADPGINYEDLGLRTIDNKKYRALKITFDPGVGDADTDVYIAHFNPDTYQLELLLYTVTFYSGEKTDKYHALAYTDWQKVGGLLVPQTLKGYAFTSGALGELRYESSYENVTFNKKAPDEALFEMPVTAEVDSMPKN